MFRDFTKTPPTYLNYVSLTSPAHFVFRDFIITPPTHVSHVSLTSSVFRDVILTPPTHISQVANITFCLCGQRFHYGSRVSLMSSVNFIWKDFILTSRTHVSHLTLTSRVSDQRLIEPFRKVTSRNEITRLFCHQPLHAGLQHFDPGPVVRCPASLPKTLNELPPRCLQARVFVCQELPEAVQKRHRREATVHLRIILMYRPAFQKLQEAAQQYGRGT